MRRGQKNIEAQTITGLGLFLTFVVKNLRITCKGRGVN